MTLSKATRRQRQTLVAYLQHGSYKGAAKALGINENTARTRIHYMLRVTGARTVTEAAYLLGREQGQSL
jgi:DNA-binding NarL/FixJ family response regulator